MRSPDGQWTWNGAQWVPTAQYAAPHQAPQARRSVFWPVLGALVAFAVIAVVTVSLFVSSAHDERVRKARDDAHERWMACHYAPDGHKLTEAEKPLSCP
jgi:hypothetical protein